jgi:hypothetical protein
VVVSALGAVALLRRSRGQSPEVELYLQFRESCRRAGFRADAGVAPLVLLDELASVRHPAHSRARRLVDYYLRARFGGQELDPRQKQEMRNDLTTVRRRLRRTLAPIDVPRPRL